MKLPFYNRKRYLVLKCYTWHQGVFDKAKLTTDLGRKEDYRGPQHEANFHTCLSRLATKKNSVTLPCPCDFIFSCDGTIAQYRSSDADIGVCDFSHDLDPAYASKKDFVIVKMVMPWHIEEETGTSFVVARHMLNRSMMNVLSGLISFDITASSSFFNVIPKIPHEYSVAFGEPLISYYPMTDKPVHVECYYDVKKYNALREQHYSTHFRAKGLKQLKMQR